MAACPSIGCDGTLDLKKIRGQLILDNLKTQCTKCMKNYCKDCRQPWHQGKLCKVENDDIGWDLVGNSQGKANRCPKCKSTFEKSSGCMHMTCSLCGYEWCWVCGLPHKHFIHYIQLSGVGCELLGQISFSKVNCCLKLLMTCGILLLWPLVCLFISLLFGFMMPVIATENCSIWKIPGKILNSRMIWSYGRLKSCFKKFICFVPLIIFYLVTFSLAFITVLLIIAFYITGTLLIGGLVYAIIVIPTTILIWFSFFRKLCLWSGDRNYKKNKKKALL